VHCAGLSLSKVILFKEQCVLCRVFSVPGYHSEEDTGVGLSLSKVILFKEQCVLSRVFSVQGYPHKEESLYFARFSLSDAFFLMGSIYYYLLDKFSDWKPGIRSLSSAL
jgi:hypothetical protein